MTKTVRHLPKIRCDAGFLDEGPHSGCSEFAPSTWHDCTEPATHTIKWPATLYGGPARGKACAFHARQEPSARTYRFRKGA